MGRRFVPTERRMQRIRAQQFQTNAEGAVRDYEQSIVWLFTVPPIILGLIFIFPFAGEENWRQLWSSSCQTVSRRCPASPRAPWTARPCRSSCSSSPSRSRRRRCDKRAKRDVVSSRESCPREGCRSCSNYNVIKIFHF